MKSRKLYNIENGLQVSLVCVLDILGYKNKLKYPTTDEGNKKLKELHDVISKALRNAKNNSQNGEYPISYLKVYTDNILIAFPLDSNKTFNAQFRSFEFILYYIQVNFIQYKYLIRGAIDIGEIYVDDSMVFGKSLLDTHLLESKKAIYPRIILSDKLAKKFEQICLDPQPNYYTGKAYDEWDFAINTNNNKDFILKNNSYYFLNYLEKSYVTDYSEMESPYEIIDFSFFVIHKEQILTELDAVQKNINNGSYKIIIKLLWLACYHNFYLEKLIDKYKDYEGENHLIDIQSHFGKEWNEYAYNHPDFQFEEFFSIISKTQKSKKSINKENSKTEFDI